MTHQPTDITVLTFEARDNVYSSVAASRALVRRFGMTQELADRYMQDADRCLSQGLPYTLPLGVGSIHIGRLNWLKFDLIGAGYTVSTHKE